MHSYCARAAVLGLLAACACLAAWPRESAAEEKAGDQLRLTARLRVADTAGPGSYVPQEKPLEWAPDRTAIIICDMWDVHWCQGATNRVGEVAPRMDAFVKEARGRGVLIVHAPSSCMEAYQDHPARKRAQAAPQANNLPADIAEWCRHIPAEGEGTYPIDQSDGGCDCEPMCAGGNPWRRQVAAIGIADEDAISDSGVEIWNLFAERGIENVIIMGVHTNMCVLGRPFGLRNLSRYGKNVVLARDLTDTMYNHRSWPYVDHCRGTDLIVEHIEKYVCPTITSDQLLGGEPFRFAEDQLALADGGLPAVDAASLPDTAPLTLEGDIASTLVEGADKFLLRKLDESAERRAQHWNRDLSSAEAYNKSIEPNRQRLAHILGVRDARVPFDGPELAGTTEQPALVGKGEGFEAFAIRWPAFGDVHGEGLLLVPTGRKPVADVVAIPDADQLPEQLAGLVEGVPVDSQFARVLAENGCRVVVPVLMDRHIEARLGRAQLTNREFIYRSAFELGRHLIGYEVQKVLAAVDWFSKDAGDSDPQIGVIGYGEGGMLALYAAALDVRIDAACVSGYIGDRRETVWEQPIDRNVFGLLDQFGDAELATMVAPRKLVVDVAASPAVELPGNGGAPAKLTSHNPDVLAVYELERADKLLAGFQGTEGWFVVTLSGKPAAAAAQAPFCGLPALVSFGSALGLSKIDRRGGTPQHLRTSFDPAARQARQLHELDRHSQHLLTESHYVRQEFMKNLDTSSLEAYRKSVEPYRQIFRDDVIGHFDDPVLPANPRSRKAYDTEKWTGYEVVLDVFPDVIAYGILLVPKDLKEGERRPCVVCQHGLEGRPQDVVTGDKPAYHDFAAKLAERGFVTFAPQNLYIFTDRFRTLQRKANPLGKTLFSIITPQHQQIVDWLQTLPYVDPRRVGFYGLSYGGKTAMRVPALVPDYCLSICSADFGEWVWKNSSTRTPFSYIWGGEYEIFEFDLGSTFNYAEMAALIAPRPFMVERGHFDGVEPDEAVGYEFAKVQNLYQARLGIGDRTRIEWFVGPHTINGVGTYDFLHEKLDWPKRGE